MNNLPQRLRESSFHKYEDDLCSAVTAYPLTHTINPTKYGLSAVTVVARIRDAKLSLKLYRWSTKINLSKFDQIESDLTFTHRGSLIISGSRDVLKIKQELKPTGLDPLVDEPTINTDAIAIPNHSKELICHLVAVGLCCPLRVSGFEPPQIEHFESSYDVRIDDNNDGTQTIS